MRVNQAAKTLEMRYMHLLTDHVAVTAKLGKHMINKEGQCLFDVYIDSDCMEVIKRAVKLAEWRKANNRLLHKPVMQMIDFD